MVSGHWGSHTTGPSCRGLVATTALQNDIRTGSPSLQEAGDHPPHRPLARAICFRIRGTKAAAHARLRDRMPHPLTHDCIQEVLPRLLQVRAAPPGPTTRNTRIRTLAASLPPVVLFASARDGCHRELSREARAVLSQRRGPALRSLIWPKGIRYLGLGLVRPQELGLCPAVCSPLRFILCMQMLCSVTASSSHPATDVSKQSAASHYILPAACMPRHRRRSCASVQQCRPNPTAH